MNNVEEFKSLADELMTENSDGTAFTNAIPADWPTEAWMYILEMKSEIWDEDSLQSWIAGHTYAPQAVVYLLPKSPHSRVRNRIASKRNLPKELFLVMARDPEESMRTSIAANKKTPLNVVHSLAEDASEAVRRVVNYRFTHDLENAQRS